MGVRAAEGDEGTADVALARASSWTGPAASREDAAPRAKDPEEACASHDGAVVQGSGVGEPADELKVFDIEHTEVHDDPREWSRLKKHLILFSVAFSAMGGGLSGNILFPAVGSLQEELQASDQAVALGVSLFILGQGLFQVIWSTLADMKGRKGPYLWALVIYCGSTIGCAKATSIEMFLVMRVLQSVGGSPLLSLGAGTLSDIFDSHERGEKVGLFYGLPLGSVGFGPLLGGALTLAPGGWRNVFWGLLGYGAVSLAISVVLPDTFRRQRSLPYRLALRRQQVKAAASPTAAAVKEPRSFFGFGRMVSRKSSDPDRLKLRPRDLNPFASVGDIFKQKHNLISNSYSGLLFAAQYATSYSSSRTFLAPPYNYSSITVGLVLMAFGGGSIMGNVLGGRWSDRSLRILKEKNGGVMVAEFRIRSTFGGMVVAPLTMIAFGWTIEKRTHIAGPIICLFSLGMSLMWIYSSTLAYLVDSNPGRSTTAIACNSLFRGIAACILSQVNTLIIASMGDGWYYTSFAFVIVLTQLLFVLLYFKGQQWREADQASDSRKARNADTKGPS